MFQIVDMTDMAMAGIPIRTLISSKKKRSADSRY